MFNILMYQLWVLLTLTAMIAAVLLGIMILQQEDDDNEQVVSFKKAVAFAFFSVSIEVISRFISLITNKTSVPNSELIICSFGRFLECIGLWGLLLFILKVWPFNSKK